MIQLIVPAALALIGWGIKKIMQELSRKQFAILGEKESGKTFVHNFLTTGSIPLSYIQTKVKRTGKGEINLEDYHLDIKESEDISGSDDFRHKWENLITEADYTCYMVRMDKVYFNDMSYISMVEGHISTILNYLEKKEKKTKLYLLCSFCDKIDEYKKNPDNFRLSMLQQKLRKINKPNTELIFGSMNSNDEAKKLIAHLLSNILKK